MDSNAEAGANGMWISRLTEPDPRRNRGTHYEPNIQGATPNGSSEGVAKGDNPNQKANPVTNLHLLVYSAYAAGVSLIVGLLLAELVPTRWSPSVVWLVTTIGIAIISITVALPILRRINQWKGRS